MRTLANEFVEAAGGSHTFNKTKQMIMYDY